MKINNSSPPNSIHGSSQIGQAARASEAPARAPTSSAPPLGQMNAALLDSKHDVDSLRVNEVKQAIVDGKLEIDAAKIAEGLLENLKGL